MFRGSLSLLFRLCRAVSETIAIVAGFYNVTVVREPVEQRRGHLCVAEDVSPLREAQIGCDDDARALVEFAQQMEEQGAAGLAERQITQFVEDDEVSVHQTHSQLPGLSGQLLLLKRIDEFNGGEEAYAASIMFDRLHANRRRQMRFARARRTGNTLPTIMPTTWSFVIRSIRAAANEST